MTGGTSGQGQEIYGRSQRDVHMQGYLHALPWFLAGPAAGRHRHQLRSGRRHDHRRLGAGRRAAHHRRHRLPCRRHPVDRCQDRPDAAHRRGQFHLRLDQLSAHADRSADAAAASSRNARFRPCARLFIAAEGYPLEWAERIEALWGCRLQEGYGSTQCAGFGGSTCADGALTSRGERGLMHLFEWETLFEIIDPDDARAGQESARSASWW